MKFSLSQKDLQESLGFCQNVIERRSTLPILSNVLIEAKNKILKITATDLDMIFVHNISNVEIDTCHFKGNFPDRASIQTIDLRNEKDKLKAFETSSDWEFFLGEKKCKADSIHNFGKDDFLHEKKVSHVRLNIYPDGGVSRFRIFGQPIS